MTAYVASRAPLFSPRPESAHEARMGEVIGQSVADVAALNRSPVVRMAQSNG